MKRLRSYGTPSYPYKSQDARRRRLISEGLCTACGRAPALPDRRYCGACGLASQEANARSRSLALECGICVRCRKRATEGGRWYCPTCTKKAAKEARDKWWSSPCPRCGGSRADGVVKGSPLCRTCRIAVPTNAEWHLAYYQKRLGLGLCVRCGGERGSDGTARMCRPCADRVAERQRGYAKKATLQQVQERRTKQRNAYRQAAGIPVDAPLSPRGRPRTRT